MEEAYDKRYGVDKQGEPQKLEWSDTDVGVYAGYPEDPVLEAGDGVRDGLSDEAYADQKKYGVDKDDGRTQKREWSDADVGSPYESYAD